MTIIKAKPAPLCRYCGKPLDRHVEWVHLVDETPRIPRQTRYVVGRAKSMSDCRRYAESKSKVISVTKHRDGHVIKFSEWDGVSYEAVMDFFCTQKCAMMLAWSAVAHHGVTGARFQEETLNQAKAEANE